MESRGITPRREVITYCSDGRHASLVWFAMSQLLGYAKVRLYDGSWAEYQGLIGAPMEASGPHHTLY